MSNKRILFAGESWATYGIHTKGAASYTTSGYEEGATVLLGVLKDAGFDVTYVRNHEAVEGFPYTTEEFADRFDLVVLSDIPADSLPPRLREARERIRPEPMDWALLQERTPAWMRYWDEHIRGKGR